MRGPELRAARERLQIVFQDPLGALDPRMTVAELVAEPLLEFRSALVLQHPTLVGQMLRRVGLGAELSGRFPRPTVGGQRQRVGVARALMLSPQLLICDEPVAALDVSIKSQIANLLRDMRDELQLSLLLIAHDLAHSPIPVRPRYGAVPRPGHGNRTARGAVRRAAASLQPRAAGGQPGSRSAPIKPCGGHRGGRAHAGRCPARLRFPPPLPDRDNALRRRAADPAPGRREHGGLSSRRGIAWRAVCTPRPLTQASTRVTR